MPKPELLAQIAEHAVQQGQTQLAQTLIASLLEMHYHLFVAGEYEQAGELVTLLVPLLHTIGRREVAKALLHQSIASLEGDNKYVAKGNLATLLIEEGKWQEALAAYRECIDYLESLGDEGKNNVAVLFSQQAQIYGERGEYEQALELERRALQIKEELGDKSAVIQYYRIAQLLLDMERYDEALAAGEQALVKARAINHQSGIASCLHLLGLTLNDLNRQQEACARFQESLAIEEKLGNRAGQADTLGEMGKLLLYAGQFEAAMNFFQKAIAIFYELNDPLEVAISLEAIGTTFALQGHFSEALEKYQEALRLKKQYAVPPESIARTENNIARAKEKMKSQ